MGCTLAAANPLLAVTIGPLRSAITEISKHYYLHISGGRFYKTPRRPNKSSVLIAMAVVPVSVGVSGTLGVVFVGASHTTDLRRLAENVQVLFSRRCELQASL